MKILFIIFFVLISFSNVNTLSCYVTNFDYLETLNVSTPAVTRDCHKYLFEHDKSITSRLIPILAIGSKFRCYTIGVRAKSELNGNETTDVNVDLQVCGYEDNCDYFFEQVQKSPLALTGNVSCTECYGDWCNSEREFVPELKTYTTHTTFRRSLYIGAGGCGVLGVVGAILRLLCCVKLRSERSFESIDMSE